MGILAPNATPGSRSKVGDEGAVEVGMAGARWGADEAGSERRPQPEIRALRKAWQDAAEPLTTIVKWLWKNAAAGILLVGAFLVVKGLVLSKGSTSVALGILQNAGLSTVVIGGLLSALPILAAAILATTIYHAITRDHGENILWYVAEGTPLWRACKAIGGNFRQNLTQPTLSEAYLRVSPLTVVMLVAAVLCALLTQWSIMVAAVIIGLVIGVIRCTGKKWLRGTAYLAAGLIGLIAVIAMLYTVSPFHPPIPARGWGRQVLSGIGAAGFLSQPVGYPDDTCPLRGLRAFPRKKSCEHLVAPEIPDSSINEMVGRSRCIFASPHAALVPRT